MMMDAQSSHSTVYFCYTAFIFLQHTYNRQPQFILPVKPNMCVFCEFKSDL